MAYSLPSGRRRVVPKEVHALYRIEQNEQGSRLALVNEEFLKSGIEAGLQIAVSGNHAWLCSGADCQKLTAGAGNAVTPAPGMQLLAGDKPLDVIEAVSDVSGQAYSLAALTFDDRTADMPPADAPVYFLCHMAAAASCQGLATDEIPYRLRIENGKPKWDAARDAGDASGLLSFDLPRAGLNGVANFGENNLEGRLAWSQAYYLNGLLSMIEQAGDLGLSEEFLEKLSQRFILECEELSLLTEHPYPGFMVKRYSLDREPLTSLLHIGRIMKPVWRGAALLPRGTVEKFSAIGRQFARADAAIEQYGLAEGRDPPAAHLRKFIPYWADGADLPWNYHSAWIEGLAWAPEKPDKMSALAKDLSEQFITKALSGLPEKWPYAAGNTLTGWSAADNVSSNTPVYGGDTSNPNGAHISYRSMDAMAVLAAGRTGITAEDAAVTRHLGALVPRGLLYPFVNEEFAARGKRMDLPVQAGRHYARIKLPWQVQNQPWALLSLPQR